MITRWLSRFNIYIDCNCFFLFSFFTLHPADVRVSREYLGNECYELRSHWDICVLHFPQNSEGIACWVAQLNAALCLVTRTRKWKYYIFHLVEWESNPQPVAFTVARLCPCTTTGLVFVYDCNIIKKIENQN